MVLYVPTIRLYKESVAMILLDYNVFPLSLRTKVVVIVYFLRIAFASETLWHHLPTFKGPSRCRLRCRESGDRKLSKRGEHQGKPFCSHMAPNRAFTPSIDPQFGYNYAIPKHERRGLLHYSTRKRFCHLQAIIPTGPKSLELEVLYHSLFVAANRLNDGHGAHLH